MQEPGAKSQAGCDAFLVANCVPNVLELSFVLIVHFYIRQHSKVIARTNATQMSAQIVAERFPGSQSAGVLGVGVKLNTVVLENRILSRKGTGLFVFAGQLTGLDLAGFDVGLIERVDADNRTNHGGRDLPPEEFLTKIVGVVYRNSNHRIPGIFAGL